MSLLDQLPDLCDIRRRVRTQGSLGGSKDAYETDQTGVRCWEQPAGDSESARYNKRGMTVTHKLYFISDPGVTERNQIIVTSKSGTAIAAASRVALDVVSEPMPDASAGLGVLYKVMCKYEQGSED